MSDTSLLRAHPYTGQTLVGFRLGQYMREWVADHSGRPEDDYDLMAAFLRSLPMVDAERYMDIGFRRLLDDASEWQLDLDASYVRQNPA